MEGRKEKNSPWLSVPQFGDWEQKGVLPDYSMDFTKIREMRKQNKRDPSRASLGNEDEIMNPQPAAAAPAKLTTARTDITRDPHSPSQRRSFFSIFDCCVKA